MARILSINRLELPRAEAIRATALKLLHKKNFAQRLPNSLSPYPIQIFIMNLKIIAALLAACTVVPAAPVADSGKLGLLGLTMESFH